MVLLDGKLSARPEIAGLISAELFETSMLPRNGELLATIRSLQPHVVLLDADVPDECSAVCGSLSTEFPDIVLIAITTSVASAPRLQLLASGCSDVIAFPDLADEIVPRLHIHLQRLAKQYQLQRQVEALQQYQDNLEKQVQLRTAALSRNNAQLRNEIRQRVLIESQLRAREEQFRTLAENASDIIVRYDRQCRRTYVNPAYEKVTSMRATAVLGKTPVELSNLFSQGQAYQAALEKVIATSINADVMFDWETDTGSRIVYQTRIVPEFDRQGKVMSVLAIGRNISALKDAERHLQESRAQLQELALHSEAMREGERKQIARELHDELGQLLTTLRMRTRLLQPEFIGTDEALLRERTTSMLSIIDNAMEKVRNVVSNLRPGILDLDIASALQWLGHEFVRNHDIDCEVSVPEVKFKLDDERSVALFRIAQESLTNIVKHSGASRVDMAFRQRSGLLILEIQDDGRGFDPVQSAKKKSFGLLGIKERVQMLHGQVFIDSAIGRGVTLRVEIPVASETRQEEPR